MRDPEKLAFVTQTTLSVDDTAAIVNALRERFPTLASPRREDICYATQNRQDAVKELIANCDVLIVVGSITSSNSNRLRELAERAGRPGYLIDDASFLQREWFEGKNAVGVTAGASAPEELVQQVVARLREWGGATAQELVGREEHVVFSLPRALRTRRQLELTQALTSSRQQSALRSSPSASTANRRPFWSMRISTQRVSGVSSAARDHARRGPVAQIVVAVAHGDRVVAKPGSRADAEACRRLGRKLSFARVARVLAKVLVLRGLQGEQRLDRVAAAFSQRVRAPHDTATAASTDDHHERREDLGQREAPRD